MNGITTGKVDTNTKRNIDATTAGNASAMRRWAFCRSVAFAVPVRS
jgi:hypothetical protein